MKIKITAVCESSPSHIQKLTIDEKLGKAYAKQLAGLLDGTSPMYLYPPGPESVIGKCGICKAQIKCNVTEE
jgi:hypothetical protein